MAIKTSKQKYYEAVGRRKTSTARVRIMPDKKSDFIMNEKPITETVVLEELRKKIIDPLIKTNQEKEFSVSVIAKGGGISSQADAVRHGLSRALVKFNEEFRDVLKKAGYLKRDPRAKERRKFGLKKARKAAQWSKR